MPDSWLIGVALLSGAGIGLTFYRWQPARQQRWLALLAFSVSYGLLSLQLYVTALILLPILLPVAVLWVFCLPAPARLK